MLSRRDFLKLSGTMPLILSIVGEVHGQHSLRDLAHGHGLKLGTGISGWWFSDQKYQEKYKAILAREFDVIVVNWGLYWPQVEPEADRFEFTIADKQISFALQKRKKVRGHPLVFPTASHAIADWVVKGNFSRDRLVTILRNHITKIVGHYRGKVSEWVVINEPYIHPYRQADIFQQTIGTEYLEIAFRAAREADPSATLIYNDTDNHSSQGMTTKLTRSNLQRLKRKALVDVVGVQMHLNAASPPKSKDVVATLKSYEAPVYITELDVNLKNVPGTQAEKYRVQARVYQEIIEACLESSVCRSITFWEVGDKYSWAEWPTNEPDKSPTADMTLYDDDLEPKPAYFAIRDILSNPTRLR